MRLIVLVGLRLVGGVSSVGGIFLRAIFMRVLETTINNSERLSQQIRPGSEPGTSR